MTENTCELVPVNEDVANTQMETLVEGAFGKSLASVIMAQFPVASIIAIFTGRKASKLVTQADEIAAQTGENPGGKRVAAKIMSLIGFISGIYYTAFYAMFGTLYLIYFIAIFIMMLTQL